MAWICRISSVVGEITGLAVSFMESTADYRRFGKTAPIGQKAGCGSRAVRVSTDCIRLRPCPHNKDPKLTFLLCKPKQIREVVPKENGSANSAESGEKD